MRNQTEEGQTLDAAFHARVDRAAFAALEVWPTDRDTALVAAQRDLASLVEADTIVERSTVTWGQVKTLTGGTTVAGDPLDVWRLHELLDDVRGLLRLVESGREPRLQVATPKRMIVDHPNGRSVPQRAMDFLARATASGADPAFVRHLVGGFLAHHGYPWLWIPYKLADDYRRALVACRRFNDGTALARTLCASLDIVAFRNS